MSVWEAVCRLLSKHLATGERLDALLEGVPVQISADDRRRCRHLLYGTLRHFGILDATIDRFVTRRPRGMLLAVLLTGAFDLYEHPENAPRIVHHWVGAARELTSEREARMVNAVLRRLPAAFAEIARDTSSDAESLSVRFSHPAWLVRRWLERFGLDATLQLLTWNQRPAPVYARVPESSDPAVCETLPTFFEETQWKDFFLLTRPDWTVVEPLLQAGKIYLQDPATAIAPGLLGVSHGETVLDVCSAPGGKTIQLAEHAGTSGRVVSVDLPGPRLERLARNLASRPALRVTTIGADATTLTREDLARADAPESFDAVLVDVPCSNTGVLRHRVDVKRRLRPADIDQLAQLQLSILRRIASFVRIGGRLVYGTCSLEREENEAVVAGFLAAADNFELEETRLSRPWEHGCDGAGVFLLRRVR